MSYLDRNQLVKNGIFSTKKPTFFRHILYLFFLQQMNISRNFSRHQQLDLSDSDSNQRSSHSEQSFSTLSLLSILTAESGLSTIDEQEFKKTVDNKQGEFQFINNSSQTKNFKEDHPEEVKDLINELEFGDYSSLALLWEDNVKQTIKFIIKNWKMFAPQFSSTFQSFLNVCHLHCCNKQLTELNQAMFSDLFKLNKQLENKLTYEGRREHLNLKDQHKNNYFLPQFISQLKVKSKKEGSYFVKDDKKNLRTSMAEYIADQQYFKNNQEKWKKILFEATCLVRYNENYTQHEDIKEQILNVYKFAKLSTKNHELGQPCNRLCCSKFMYLGVDISPLENQHLLYRPKLSNLKPYVKITSKKRPKIQQTPNKQQNNQLQETMLDICGLLNAGGGVVVFNVKQEYLQLRPYGESLLISQMKEYKEVIQEGIKNIHPKVQVDQQIAVSFVPIVKHPYQYGYNPDVVDPDDRKINREYILGLYVMRISVLPSQSSQVYCYLAGENTKSAVIRKSKRVTLCGREIVEEMRRKFQFFHIQAQSEQQAALLAKDYTYVQTNHKCDLPYEGMKMAKKLEQESATDLSPESKYARVSLIVAPRKNYDDIIRTLKNKGINVTISQRFIKYNFKSTSSSAPIFHNQRFDQLLGQMAYKKQFQFDGRHALLIKVTKHLKFSERKDEKILPEGDFISLNKWLFKEFPKVKMKYLTYTNSEGKVDHYLKTDEPLATMWLYYVLHQFGQKMLFKDPGITPDLEQKVVYQSQYVQSLSNGS